MAFLGRYILAAIGLAAVIGGVLAAVYLTAPRQAGPDLARTKKSAHGLFVASIAPDREPITQGELHSWILTLKSAAGEPVENAAIDISGGMPRHNHGLPTSPQATDYLGGGQYRIDGIKFSMTGWWTLHFNISAKAGSDSVTFNVVL